MYLSRSTWQALGLSVAGGYVLLGTFAVAYPSTAAKTFFNVGNGVALWPFDQTQAPPSSGNTPDAENIERAVNLLTPLLGARDLSIAAAIFTLSKQGRYPEVGTVILAGTILCLADVVAAWKQRGPALGVLFLVGAAKWGVIGWGLQNWY